MPHFLRDVYFLDLLPPRKVRCRKDDQTLVKSVLKQAEVSPRTQAEQRMLEALPRTHVGAGFQVVLSLRHNPSSISSMIRPVVQGPVRRWRVALRPGAGLRKVAFGAY